MGFKHSWNTRTVHENDEGSLEVSLNLTPLMDVMSNILFFLLAAFGTSAVAVIATVVPTQSSEQSPPPTADVKDEVMAMLRMQHSVLTLSFTSDTVPVEVLESMKKTFQPVSGEPDVKSLSVFLQQAKERYPASKSIMLVADDQERYQTLVHVMDAAREVVLQNGNRVKLFHNVVLSGMHTDP